MNAWVHWDCESGMAMSGLGYEISPLRAWWTIPLRLVLSTQTPVTVFRADFSVTACLHCPNNRGGST